MKRVAFTLWLAIVAAVGLMSAAPADTMSSSMAAAPVIMTPGSLTWTPIKGIDHAWMAVVYGDPNKAGSLYTVRIKLANGAKAPVHWHSDSERLTVLSGMFMVGVGKSFDMASMKALAPGSFVFMPAGVRHYAMGKGETIVQITGRGPMTMNMK